MSDISVTGFAPGGVDAAPAIRIGDVFSRSWTMFAAHWFAYCCMMGFGYAPIVIVAALAGLAQGSQGPIGAQGQMATLAIIAAFIIGVAVFLWLLLAPAAINFGVAQEMSGRRYSFGQSVGVTLRRSPAILAVMILTGLYGGLASLLLVIPGLIVFCIYSVAIPACVFEGLGPLKSLSRSAFLTRGNRWRIFGFLALLYIGGPVLEQLLSFIAGLILGALPSLVVSLPFDIAVSAFSAVAVGALYAQLRIAREGVDIEHIAKVFD
jgi:uncharacterized membrane protein